MNFSEKELEDWFFSNPQEFYKPVEWQQRQLKLPSGIADVVGIGTDGYTEGDIFVVELKAVELKSRDICQVIRYREDLRRGVEGRDAHACLVGIGGVSKQLVFEARAACVSLITVEASFKLSGAWSLNDEFDDKCLEQLRSTEWIQDLNRQDEELLARKSLRRAENRLIEAQAFYSGLVENWEAANDQ